MSLRSSARPHVRQHARKFATISALLLIAGLAFPAAGQNTTKPTAAAGDKGSESYSIGFEAGRELARSLKDDAVDLDQAALLAGLTDGLAGTPNRLSEAEMKRLLADLHRRVAERQAQERYKSDPVFKALADSNAARAKALVDERGAAQGARKLDSGVVYRTLRAGEGEPAGDAKAVVITFHAALADGRQVAHGVELEIDTAGLLPGARQLIAALHAGERVTAVLPPAAAFGLAGRDSDVGPNEAILIEAELVSIKR